MNKIFEDFENKFRSAQKTHTIIERCIFVAIFATVVGVIYFGYLSIRFVNNPQEIGKFLRAVQQGYDQK